MNVLSLFDGMSCGRIALERCGFKVENYFASEIDKHAIKVAKANYPDTVHLGDVTQVVATNFPKIDLLLGGSPCQGFSFAGGQLAFDDPRSKLFFEFVRLLKELKPRWFLLENVPMKREFQDVISDHLGVKPVRLNSNIVSAQNRDRLYWTNIPVKSFPKNKRIYLKDILQDVTEIGEEHYHSMKSVVHMERSDEQTSFNFEEFETKSGLIMAGQADLKGHDYNRRVYHPDGKAPTLAAASGGNLEPKILQVPRGKNKGGIKANDGKVPAMSASSWEYNNVVTDGLRWRKLTPLECERLQTVPDNYTNHVSNTQRYRMLGNGWTIDVICHLLKGMKNGKN